MDGTGVPGGKPFATYVCRVMVTALNSGPAAKLKHQHEILRSLGDLSVGKMWCGHCGVVTLSSNIHRCSRNISHKVYCQFCAVDSRCPQCAVPCAICARQFSQQTILACNTCALKLCIDHCQFCRDCAAPLCDDPTNKPDDDELPLIKCSVDHVCDQGKKKRAKK